jgi:hypothetical protein
MFRQESGNITGAAFLLIAQSEGLDKTKENEPAIPAGMCIDGPFIQFLVNKKLYIRDVECSG